MIHIYARLYLNLCFNSVYKYNCAILHYAESDKNSPSNGILQMLWEFYDGNMKQIMQQLKNIN